MSTIETVLRNNKSNLSANTIRTYSGCIRNISKTLGITAEPSEFLKNKNLILKHLQTLNFKRRKLCIASLLLYLAKEDETKKFFEMLRNIMLQDIKLTNEELEKQEMTIKQKNNWMTWDEVLEFRDKLESIASSLLNKKTLNIAQYNKLMDYIIVCLYTYQAPRRLEYIHMRPYGFPVKDVGETDNYIDVKRKMFVFQNYKTKKIYDEQEIAINPKLFTILKLFSKVVPPFEITPENNYLLLDTKGKMMTASKLSQRLNSIFNKENFSVNMLRHIYISENVLPDQARINYMKEQAENMGHNMKTQQLYKKFENTE